MKRTVIAAAGCLIGSVSAAENLDGIDRFICAPGQVQVCIEFDTCYAASPADLGMPDFVIIDTDEQIISTTPASGDERSSAFSSYVREAGLISLQGIEGERAFSFVIDEATGRLTAAVSLDGMTVTAFGACTATEGL